MFKKNVGNLDRVLRIVIGVAMLAGFFLNRDATYSWLYLLGIIPLATGLMSSCLIYTILGRSSCPVEKR